jgi:hypothetical protein
MVPWMTSLRGADVFAADDAAIQCADVIGGVISGDVLGADEVDG